jgi:transcriptional regulator with XRE-family HTH domain
MDTFQQEHLETAPPETEAGAAFEAEVASVTDQIRALRADGLTAKQIRERLPAVSAWVVNCAINRDAKARAVHPGLRARAKDADRERARALRLEGKTYKQIQAELSVSQSTLSMWLRDLPHPEPDRTAHAAHMREVRKTKIDAQRSAEKAAAFAQVGGVSDRELMLLGVALYWSEGAKDKPYARRESIDFINSDPGMIRLFLRWLDLMGVEHSRRRYRVSIHESADVVAAEEYWRSVIGLPGIEFSRATLKRHNPKTVRKQTGADYHGCLCVKVLQGCSLYRRVDGWWRGILEARAAGDVPN